MMFSPQIMFGQEVAIWLYYFLRWLTIGATTLTALGGGILWLVELSPALYQLIKISTFGSLILLLLLVVFWSWALITAKLDSRR